MRLGESLLERGAVDPAGLARALDEQPLTGKRIGSLLIARGLAEQDVVARALGELHGVPAVLARHLAGRDPTLAALIAAEYARANGVLPIGRTRGGELIVGVRDPRPDLIAALEAMVDGLVMLAVAPADAIDALIASVYGDDAVQEFDVDLETGPIAMVDDDDAFDRIASGAMTLVGLDDARVTKDPTQSGAIMVPGGRATTPSTPPRTAPVATPPTMAPVPETRIPPRAEHADHACLADRLAEVAQATSRDAATDAVMAYLATRWTTSLLFTIKEGAALGHRGHGVQPSQDAVTAAAFPLAAPSLLKLAHDTRTIATDPPAGAATIQDRLARLLAQPTSPAVAPIVVGPRVIGLLAVGDAVTAPAQAVADLGALAGALGTAYARILRDAKR